jgi:hypothetical protein
MLTLPKRPNWVGALTSFSWRWKHIQFQKYPVPSEHYTMDEVNKLSYLKCIIPSSKPFRIYSHRSQIVLCVKYFSDSGQYWTLCQYNESTVVINLLRLINYCSQDQYSCFVVCTLLLPLILLYSKSKVWEW